MRKATSRLRRQELAALVCGLSRPVVDEMAVPSYTHWNPFIRWLMWERIAAVQGICSWSAVDTAVDFGTGSGVLLPFLSRLSRHVIALDKCVEPACRLCQTRELHNVDVHCVDGTSLPLPDNSADIVVCLDVLEHVEHLEDVARELTRILEKDGLLIVSGPSENALYRLGRWAAGFGRRAGYHRCNVDVVRQALERELVLTKRLHLPPVLRLFEIDTFKKPHPATAQGDQS